MRKGDSVYIESLRYVITATKGRRAVLIRRPVMTLKEWTKRRRAHRWTRLVSANFLIDKKTGETITNYEMLAIGLPSEEIERLHRSLPLAETDHA